MLIWELELTDSRQELLVSLDEFLEALNLAGINFSQIS